MRAAKGGSNSVAHSGWVDIRHVFAVVSLADFTHPVIASLDHPPFCKQKGGDF
ncbi:MAG: hypothetical protein JO080_03030 [Mucilaginibacter sp.]|nr:hypothetical protein [Mucilaginibacter sp.]